MDKTFKKKLQKETSFNVSAPYCRFNYKSDPNEALITGATVTNVSPRGQGIACAASAPSWPIFVQLRKIS